MKILVTGASGFVGRALVAYMVARGHDVICAVRSHSQAQLLESFIAVGDINARTDWHAALRGADVVVHLAGRAHVLNEWEEDPLHSFRDVNVAGTLNLARQALAEGVRRLVFVSTIGVLGGQSRQPFIETDLPVPLEPYAISKWEAESGLFELLKSAKMELVVIRPPLVYGPDAPGNFGRLTRAIQRGFLLPLGAVNNKRSFVALGNLVDLIHCCACHPSAANEVFLAADGEDISTTELLRRLGSALGKSPRLLPMPVGLLKFLATISGHQTMVQKLCGDLQIDISKARLLLGWTPPLSVFEGLRQVAKGS